MSFSKSVVFISAVVVCVAVILSAIYTRTRKRTNSVPNLAGHQSLSGKNEDVRTNPGAFPSRKTESTSEGTGTGTRKSWASTFLPFYSLGILAYVAYVVGKIMNKKYTGKRKSENLTWKKSGLRKGNSKTKITMHEIRQLEEKLQETERTVQEILLKANVTMESISNKLERYDSSEDENTYSLPKRARRMKSIRRFCTDSDTASDRELLIKRDRPHSKTSNHTQDGDSCASNASGENSSSDDSERECPDNRGGKRKSSEIGTGEVYSAKINTVDDDCRAHTS